MTANAMRNDREECLAAGMNDYLSKPIVVAELHSALERAAEAAGVEEKPIPPQEERAGNNTDESSRSTAAEAGLPEGDPADEPVLDPRNLRALEAQIGNGAREFLVELVMLFKTSTPAVLDHLRAALRDGDSESLYQTAHQLKGSSANLGARRLSRLCGELEAQGRAGTTGDAPALISAIEIAFADACAALEAEVASPAATG
jgi:HPt (histidine-containing phosphotransfer) domain-containing protein